MMRSCALKFVASAHFDQMALSDVVSTEPDGRQSSA
jgi:hypothetical protein